MLQTADVVDVYELIKPKLGERENRELLKYIETRTVTLVRDEIAKGVATKADVAELRDEIAELRGEIAKLRGDVLELKEGFARLQARVDHLQARMDQMVTKEEFERLRARVDQMVTREEFERLKSIIVTREEFEKLRRRVEQIELKMATKEDLKRLEVMVLSLDWRMKLYLIAIGALIILTNPKVLDFLGRLLGLVG